VRATPYWQRVSPIKSQGPESRLPPLLLAPWR
jgi:hypothetical protein